MLAVIMFYSIGKNLMFIKPRRILTPGGNFDAFCRRHFWTNNNFDPGVNPSNPRRDKHVRVMDERLKFALSSFSHSNLVNLTSNIVNLKINLVWNHNWIKKRNFAHFPSRIQIRLSDWLIIRIDWRVWPR